MKKSRYNDEQIVRLMVEKLWVRPESGSVSLMGGTDNGS